MKEMQKTVPKSGLMDGGKSEEFFRDMMYDHMGEEMARGQGLGMARLIEAQLLGVTVDQAARIYANAQVPAKKDET
jgi:Rod binding domain-containing protein